MYNPVYGKTYAALKEQADEARGQLAVRLPVDVRRQRQHKNVSPRRSDYLISWQYFAVANESQYEAYKKTYEDFKKDYKGKDDNFGWYVHT